MLKNLPSASARPPLANARALMVALIVHAAVGAALYVSDAVGRADSVPAAPEPRVEAAPADPTAQGAASRAPAAAGADPIAQGESPGAGPSVGTAGGASAAAELVLADSTGGAALAQTAVPILIQAPDTMRLGERYEVLVSLPPIPTARGSRGAGDDMARARPARNGISPIRHATLAGENLVVNPRTSALQLADSAAPTVWRWTVTPKEPGRSRLAAEVAVVHYRDGEEQIASVRGVRKDVHIEATGEQRISRFFAAQWPGLLLLLLVSTIGWLRIRFRG